MQVSCGIFLIAALHLFELKLLYLTNNKDEPTVIFTENSFCSLSLLINIILVLERNASQLIAALPVRICLNFKLPYEQQGRTNRY